MTVLEVIQKSSEFLAKKGVESPRLQAELLLAHVLKVPRMKLYLNFERALSESELATLRELVKRRGQREPLQHIVGCASCCGLELAVNRHVLVPWPETELLAEQGWQFLNQNQGSAGCPQPAEQRRGEDTAPYQPLNVLDFGTGSGCIAIALAVKCPAAQVVAVDASADALAVAKQNAARHEVADRIRFFHGDAFAALPSGMSFDLIISNPPYVPTAEIETLQPEVRDYEPRLALDGGPDGLDAFRRLAIEAGAFLKAGGRIMVEFGDGQEERVREIFQGQNWVVVEAKRDYTQRPRILIARRA